MDRLAVRLALVVPLLVLTAQHVEMVTAQPGGLTTFEGTQEAGGPVRLTLSADGARIVSFEVEGVAGGGCSWDTITLENWGGEIQLLDGKFSVTNADGDILDGSLTSASEGPARIEGSIKVHDPNKGCETPPLRWVATALPLP